MKKADRMLKAKTNKGKFPMRVVRFCHKLPRNTSTHKSRSKVLSEVVETVLKHKVISVTGVGRALDNGQKSRSNIRKVDRLYSNAWCCANNVVLGQVPVDSKSNEITAAPKLLDMLDISRAIVTTDAMGCQKEIAAKIKEEGGDYMFGLKGNQGNLRDDISLYMGSIERQEIKAAYQCHQTIDGEHGRIETREDWVCDSIDWLPEKSKWEGLNYALPAKFVSIP